MRILVTGATGFIGRHVVDYLSSLGKHELITTAAEGKEEAESLCPVLKNTIYISKNLNDKEENYYSFFNNPDCIIHLSWEGLPNYNELFHIERNLPANFYFIKNMIQNGLADITVAGTCFEYGLQDGCLNEEMPSAPVTVYGLAKDTLRKFVELLHSTYKFNLKWARFFYLYGHGQGKKTLWGQLEEAAKNNQNEFNMSMGEQLRDYISIDRAAEYISKIALQNEITGIINCCSGEPVSVRRFVENFFNERGVNMKLNFGYYPYPKFEPLAFWGETGKLNKCPPPPPPKIST
jgi:dTDP-6-deoxy-L-talose 4-dehydrogenase (NAD+)